MSLRCLATRKKARSDDEELVDFSLHDWEALLSEMEIRTLEDAGRSAMAWTEGYDGQTHYADVAKALAPAFFILATAAALMLAIL